ncbi:MAG: hypothetical protein PHU21_02165 [Elusimicrobia bacterium]|nr:hypothetical protein [Elusimicrobiota bacterium]
MTDPADRFEADLEAFLAGRPLPPGADEAALAVAARLAQADLAAESRVRHSLRARLLARQARPSLLERLWPLRLPAGLAAACAAAALLLVLMRPRSPQAPLLPAPPDVIQPAAPAAPAAKPLRVRRSRPVAPAPEALARSPFVSIPAASPFETHGKVRAGHPFVTVAGRRTRTAHGQAVVWELEHATVRLEERPVRIEELFVKPVL